MQDYCQWIPDPLPNQSIPVSGEGLEAPLEMLMLSRWVSSRLMEGLIPELLQELQEGAEQSREPALSTLALPIRSVPESEILKRGWREGVGD